MNGNTSTAAPHLRKAGRMTVSSCADRAGMAAAAAADAAAVIREALAAKGNARVVLAAGVSQTEILAALAAAPDIDWGRVTAFHMDEYIGLPEGAPQRFAVWLDEQIFLRLPFKEVHRMSPDPNPETEIRRYAGLLAEAPVDLVCLGIGVNGHIAFNDPPVADFDDPHDIKIVEMDAVCRQQQVDDGGFAAIEDVPKTAVTLTVPRLLRAARLVCTVPGAHKRPAVGVALSGPIETACPASILRRQENCALYLDSEADPDGQR
ncbi:MAG: 6-phosphogluconolactonase [Rhodospirillales bacterium]